MRLSIAMALGLAPTRDGRDTLNAKGMYLVLKRTLRF